MSREPSSRLRAVLDTNVLISMFANYPDRPIFQLWAYAVRRRYTLLLQLEAMGAMPGGTGRDSCDPAF